LARTKRTKIVATRHVSPAQDIPKSRLWPGSAQTPRGAYSTPPNFLVGFTGSASQQGRNGRVDRAGGEGREGEEWKDRGRDGEKRDDVDFAPFPPAGTRNSCGC